LYVCVCVCVCVLGTWLGAGFPTTSARYISRVCVYMYVVCVCARACVRACVCNPKPGIFHEEWTSYEVSVGALKLNLN
jgi:hypothetical protein